MTRLNPPSQRSAAPLEDGTYHPPVIEDASWAAETADRLLGSTSARYAHTCRVARQAASVRHLLTEPWRSALVEAAWLHDVGYSPQLVETGFHPLDGARWLQARGRSSEVCSLVAWHTRARTEARFRGLEDALIAEFVPPPPAAQAAMAWADLTSSPTGERWSPESRISDILRRYGPESVVHRATLTNEVELLEDAQSVADRMTESRGDAT
ncbi:MAG: HD domain-containing protein [Actinobacteria bacterium]|nr:HD domain-containing protein [Actinomycetota bacterium]